MGRPLAVNVAVVNEAGEVVILTAGSEVPAWVSEQVGEHCFEQAADGGAREPRAPRKPAK